MGGQPLLNIKNIDKRFGNVHALKNVNYTLKHGEVHALLGSNGAGKSTLMKMISGAYQQDEGEIFLNGEKLELQSPQISKENGISIVYQEFSLINDLTVAENICIDSYPLKRKFPPSIDFNEMVNYSKRVLNDMDVVIDVKKLVSQLSVGEQQIVEIAKALSTNTKVLILDEPTSALNSKEIDQLFKLVNKLKQRDVGIIYITHRLNELEQICDRVTIMRDGINIGTYDVGEKSINEMVDLMLGKARDTLNEVNRMEISIRKKILEVDKLTTSTLKDVSLSLSEGEIAGLAGQMGSGRTETLKAIFGVDHILDGCILVNNKELNKNSITPKKMIDMGIGFVSEDRKGEGIFPGRNITENIMTSVMTQVTKYYTILKGKEKQACNEMIAKTGLHPPNPQNIIESLSGGNQQKAVLGRWLALSNLKILLLDEPTRGIDVAAKAQIYSILREIAGNGVGILIASSDTEELVEISDKVYVLDRGSVKSVMKSPHITFNNLSKEVLGGSISGKSGESTNTESQLLSN